MPPVPPLCQVSSRFWNSVICQARPIWPLSASASGSSAAIPGAWFVSTAQTNRAMSAAVVQVEVPAGRYAWPYQ